MQGKDLATLSRLDEERAVKAMMLKNKQDEKNAEMKKMKYMNIRHQNLNDLRLQMKEKEQQREL